jgi:hypothetical protein
MKANHSKPQLAIVDRKGNPVEGPFDNERIPDGHLTLLAQPGAGQTPETRDTWLARIGAADFETREY